MSLLTRFTESAAAFLERMASRWDEVAVVDSACCMPDHMVPDGDDRSRGEGERGPPESHGPEESRCGACSGRSREEA